MTNLPGGETDRRNWVPPSKSAKSGYFSLTFSASLLASSVLPSDAKVSDSSWSALARFEISEPAFGQFYLFTLGRSERNVIIKPLLEVMPAGGVVHGDLRSLKDHAAILFVGKVSRDDTAHPSASHDSASAWRGTQSSC